MKTLYLIRGVSGSGKTTLADIIIEAKGRRFAKSISADDFFTDENGDYHFEPMSLSMAHKYALSETEKWMEFGIKDIVVHNTFSRQWEAQEYIDKAKQYGYTINIIECQNRFDNVHDVPSYVIENMEKRWERITEN